ncbi:MAG: tetratricopeptide repeat protein [Pirellulaceae bacterium]
MEQNRLTADSGEQDPHTADSDSTPQPPAMGSSPATGRLRGWRGWLLRIALVLASPLLFFGLIEMGLRWTGYGYPTNFFLGPDANGNWFSNDQFGWRFFPRSLARTPEPCRLPAKSPATVRIVVLGSSAAMGMPNPAFNFGRILEVMLRSQYPDAQFEVVNAAMTAINSHVAREIARDCSPHGVDMYVVYMGNNEVVGPFGPGTVFQQWSRRLAMVRFAVWMKSMRVGQLLADVLERCRPGEAAPDTWHGMEMFLGNEVTADDPRLALVYENFRSNLTDICGLARRNGAAVILSTVAVNFADCPPLASLHRADLLPEDLARWESLYQTGVAAEVSGDLQLAIDHWIAAAQIDDRFAELQFRLGRALAATGRLEEARQRFVLACDCDTLRFRADSQINAIIREVAGAHETRDVSLVDAERVFAEGVSGTSTSTDTSTTTTTKSIPGEELFYEHVHLTFEGNYRLARTLLDRVTEALPPSVRSGKIGGIPSKPQCAEWLALTQWDDFHMADAMAKLTARPPFTDQLDHDIRQAAAAKRVEELRQRASKPETLKEAVRIYEAALARRPDDWYLHDRLGHLASQCGRPDIAGNHWRVVLKEFPRLSDRRALLGEALLSQGKLDEAAAEYGTILQLNARDPEAHNGLGMVLIQQRDFESAADQFRQALELRPQYFDAQVNLGMALSEQERFDQAIACFLSAREIDPARTESHINLANVSYRLGRIPEAVASWRDVMRLQPDDVETLNQLALVLATCPIESVRNGKEAVEFAKRAVELSNGQEPVFLNTLAAAYAEVGQFDKALDTAEGALALATRQHNTALADTLRAAIQRYQAGSPLRALR